MKKPFCQNNKEILKHIDLAKPVRAYRNLHRKCISIKQDGIVRCWATNVVLENCKFIVSKAGQKRVRDEKKKNVHAYVQGALAKVRETDLLTADDWAESYYNPYHTDTFQDVITGQPITEAKFVDIWVEKTYCSILSHNTD